MDELNTVESPNVTHDKNLRRRRVLQMSGAAVAASTGVVGTVSGKHNPDNCDRSTQCNASITFSDQTVGDDCDNEDDLSPDSVTVDSADLPCGGFIDIHDPDKNTDTFKAGHPIGATTYLSPGSYSNVCIDLFEGNQGEGDTFGTCITWERQELENAQDLTAMLHLDTNDNEIFDHYCLHEAPGTGTDHAYLCDQDGDGNLEPIAATAFVEPDEDEI